MTAYETALERIAEGKGKRDDVAAVLAHAQAEGLDRVLVTVKRTKAKFIVKARGRVSMFTRGGPLSSRDRPTVLAGESQISAYFEVDEIRYWLRTHPDPSEPKPKPKQSSWRRHPALYTDRGNR